MTEVKKVRGTPFKKGQSGNPQGARLHNPVKKAIKKLTTEEVCEVGSLILQGNIEELRKIPNDPSASALKVWFTSVVMKSITKGDMIALNAFLDRIIGKTLTKIHLESDNQTQTTVSVIDDAKIAEAMKRIQESV